MSENISDNQDNPLYNLNRLKSIDKIKYPIIGDHEFSKKIGKIFKQYKIKPKKQSLKEICYPNKFTFQNPQLFVSQFINPETQYKSLLIYHKIGAGKTCAGIKICEGWKHKKNIMVVVPAALIENFYKELRSECAGEEYISNKDRKCLQELDPNKDEYKQILISAKKKINKFYNIMSYHKFVSQSQNNEIDLKNTVLLIDEVQNIISEEGTFYKTFYEEIMKAPKDLRVVLLSATPIFDRPSELGLTMNLLKPEEKFPVGTKFNQTFIKTKKTSNKISYDLKNINKLKNLLSGYISYYKGAPDHVFPTKNLKYVKCIMSRFQYEAYKTTMEQEGKGRFLDSDILDLPNNFLIGPRIISNIAFPNKGINEEGYDSFKGKTLDYDMLKIYSIKFYKIMKKIKSCKGTVFVYSNFKEYGGLKSFIKVLEYHKYKNFKDHGKGKLRFAIWSGDESIESKEMIKDFFNKKENQDGSMLKVLLGSPSIKEGVSLLRVQQVHVLEPYWNMSRLDQVVGRAIRFCSHKDVASQDREVKVYVYIGVGLKTDEITVDKHIMNLAFKKKELTDQFEDIMQEMAVDKFLFQ
jgi:superfamily II DNA or RNA helicase